MCDSPDEIVIDKNLASMSLNRIHLIRTATIDRYNDIASKLRDAFFRPKQISTSELLAGMRRQNIGVKINKIA